MGQGLSLKLTSHKRVHIKEVLSDWVPLNTETPAGLLFPQIFHFTPVISRYLIKYHNDMTLVGLFHENNDGSDYFNQNSKLKKMVWFTSVLKWDYKPAHTNNMDLQCRKASQGLHWIQKSKVLEGKWMESVLGFNISVWVLDFGEKKKADSREDSRPTNDLYSAALGRDRKALLIINHTKHLLHHELKFRPLGWC